MVHTMKRVQDDRSIARKGARRRSYEAAFKRHLVELSLVPGASVARIALDHRLNANILFKWRRHHLRELARSAPGPAAGLAAGHRDRAAAAAREAPAQTLSSASRRGTRPVAGSGVIEIDLPFGRVRLTGSVDQAALRVVIEVLSHR